MKFKRSSGILLHPTSLPGPHGCGDFGQDAFRFVDWLVEAKQSLWQMLPLGPTGMGNSPYMSPSAFAGSPLFVDLHEIVERGWLDKKDIESPPAFHPHKVDYAAASSFRMPRLKKAAQNFCNHGLTADKTEYERFCESHSSWLSDFALFMALYDEHAGALWCNWDSDIVKRDRTAVKKVETDLREQIQFHKFVQWCFFRQWMSLKSYANGKGVRIIGDIPIFVAHNSVDVWSSPDMFFLDEHGYPTVVAGVPPDYFSPTGQRWGNPLYRWDVMQQSGYQWWKERLRHSFSLFDIVRIDHFRGFLAYWEVSANERTAERGQWVKSPGEDLFEKVFDSFGSLPIVVEDLGIITPDVTALREKLELPGMKVLQFAFDDGLNHPNLPHNHGTRCMVYTGTHDNDTTVGWFRRIDSKMKKFVLEYAKSDGTSIQWDMIRLASESKADTSIFPIQDVLGLGNEARMNYPGTSTGNWEWRFTWDFFIEEHSAKLHSLTTANRRN
ncbi:MAG: 4-alpha-glucanotransferase [Bacteroidota bacterium]